MFTYVVGVRHSIMNNKKLSITRELLITILFGLITPGLWLAIFGLFSAYIEFPFLTDIAEEYGELSEKFISNYQFWFGALAAISAALLISVPFAFLLRYKHMVFYFIFVILVTCCHIFQAFNTDLGDVNDVWFLLSSSPYLVFIVSSGIFIFIVSKIKARKSA